ncbi:MAG TPA: ATP-binding protein [Bryobacteraceae bacterium]|jgi:PAS domain S-box-containing protein
MTPRLLCWQDLALHVKGLIVVALPAAATIIIAGASYMIGNREAEAEQWVQHTLQVREEIQHLTVRELEASAHVRGYFITGEGEFSARVQDSLAMFDATRENLTGLSADNPSQRRLLDQIATLERSRYERIVSTVVRYRWGVLSTGQLPLILKEAEGERVQMESFLTAMTREENRLLEIRMNRLDTLRAELRAISAICVFLGVAGGVVMSILFAKGITTRIEALQYSVARLPEGRVLDSLPHGQDEIGRLSKGVVEAASVLQRRTAALEAATYGIAELDADGRYLDFNHAYWELTGLDQVQGMLALTVGIHPDDRPLVEEAIATCKNQRSEIEVRVQRQDSRSAYVAMTVVSMLEHQGAGYFVFLRDISRRKEAEAALVQARDAAEASSLAKSQFLAKISHDIRTPLNAILGAADLLARTTLDSSQAGYVRMFQRNSRHLVSLINDFLDFAKIEAGAVRVENVPFRVREIVEDATATFREPAYRKQLTLEAEVDADVPEAALGDPLRVHQILLNLIGNAVKFTPLSGRVEVRVHRVRGADADRLRFTVCDNGLGIRAADHHRVFAAFEQSANQDAGSRDGCGLGLAICKHLVEIMGGEIGVESCEGAGSTFHFELPLVEAQAPEPFSEPLLRDRALPYEGTGETPRILVAEDTEDNRLLLTYYLQGEPVEVHFLQNGREALDAVCGGQEFDLVLMDLDMPVMGGLDAVRAIRAWEKDTRSPPIPIVGLSAHAMREAVRACLDAGCAAHVAKPVDKETLLSTIRRYRRSRGAPSGISQQVAALVPKYLASKIKQTAEAQGHLAAKDFEPIRRFGHNLKGTGAGYGFPQLEVIGAQIEKSAIGQDEQIISEQLEALRLFLSQNRLGQNACVEEKPASQI